MLSMESYEQMQLDALTRYLADISPHKMVFSNIGLLMRFPQLGKKLDERLDDHNYM